MKKLYDVELTIEPILLESQKNTLLNLIEYISEQDQENWSPLVLENLDGLINLLEKIEDQIKGE